MGKRINDNEVAELFNFYLDKETKINFLIILAENNCQGQAAAALRTLMKMYMIDRDIQKRVSAQIEYNIVYRKSGKASKL